jgi:hypothetical protein
MTDIGYAGIMGVSVTNAQILGNTVQRIGTRLADGDNYIVRRSSRPLFLTGSPSVVSGNAVTPSPARRGMT